MSVFRVEKSKGYTVMSNHHLRNHTLSLKAKGLLSQMLSLPEDWDYTLQGLAQINKESIDAIREAVRELERAGYIKRSRERDERGCLRGTVYTIYEDERYGTTVVLRHSGGFTTHYANLSEEPDVAVGDTVRAGQRLGTVGQTALTETGDAPHVHFALYNGNTPEDPAEYWQ